MNENSSHRNLVEGNTEPVIILVHITLSPKLENLLFLNALKSEALIGILGTKWGSYCWYGGGEVQVERWVEKGLPVSS